MAEETFLILAAEERQLLIERSVDIEWCDYVQHFQCVRCKRVPIIHYLSNCKHIHCKSCRDVFIGCSEEWKCLLCQVCVTQLDDRNCQLEKQIYQLRCYCPNKKYGCKYIGQLITIPKHLKDCVDTKEAALTVAVSMTSFMEKILDQISSVRVEIAQLRCEIKEVRENCETKWEQIEINETELEIQEKEINTITEQMNKTMQLEVTVNQSQAVVQQPVQVVQPVQVIRVPAPARKCHKRVPVHHKHHHKKHVAVKCKSKK